MHWLKRGTCPTARKRFGALRNDYLQIPFTCKEMCRAERNVEALLPALCLPLAEQRAQYAFPQ